MDSPAITDAFDRVTKKQKLTYSKTNEVIDRLILEIGQTRQAIEAGHVVQGTNFDHASALADLNAKFLQLAPGNEINTLQKDLNTVLAKCGKAIEKQFCSDISKACRDVELSRKIINQVIAQHFYRAGQFDMGDCFSEEAEVEPADSLKAPYLEMYQVLEHIRRRDLELALDWAKARRAEGAQAADSCYAFEFKLHQLHFVTLLHQQGRGSALAYARANFGTFASTHMAEIQRLMGCLLWAGRLDRSPYKDLLSPAHWHSIEGEFTRECCKLLGKSSECPLHVTLTAGAQALPVLLKLASLFAKRPENFQAMKQLPVEIELGPGYQFHSIFACPVSREQSTADNPPMLMPCGHVLCSLSIVKLGKGTSRTFKCPYCPMETNQSQCRPIQF